MLYFSLHGVRLFPKLTHISHFSYTGKAKWLTDTDHEETATLPDVLVCVLEIVCPPLSLLYYLKRLIFSLFWNLVTAPLPNFKGHVLVARGGQQDSVGCGRRFGVLVHFLNCAVNLCISLHFFDSPFLIFQIILALPSSWRYSDQQIECKIEDRNCKEDDGLLSSRSKFSPWSDTLRVRGECVCFARSLWKHPWAVGPWEYTMRLEHVQSRGMGWD